MKNYITILSLMATIIVGCKEEPPYINYEEPNTTIDTTWLKATPSALQEKQVILEDVTGVKCPNCPDAAAITKALEDAHPNRINAIAIHPYLLDGLTHPIDEDGHKTKQDFRTQEGTDLCKSILGIPQSLPKGAINRIWFSGQSEILMERTNWTEKTEQELNVPAPVNITLDYVTEIDGKPVAANEIWIDVMLEYTSTVSDTNFLTIALVEDSIVDVQEYTDYSQSPPKAVYNDNYVHSHILRDLMTSSTTGDVINKPGAPLVAGRVFLKRYKYTVVNNPAKGIWVRKNMHAIAIVHKNRSATKDVLQSNHVELH